MTAPMGEPGTGARRVVRRRFPPDVRRAKVAIPNGLTLGNLFFGINAIIAASRGNFDNAVLYVVLGGVCDAFDGAAARATRTGGRFGEELDSLVDAISFGLAPAMIVHFSTLANGLSGWNWAVFVFVACAVMRLARFNVTQAGGSKTYFQGLPSPAAGGTLATYYWFSQTSFYQNNEAIVGLPWHQVMQVLMIVLGFLMVSSVPYPAWPKIGLRSLKGLLGLAGILFILFGIGFWRRAFFFPFGIGYVTYGLLRAALLGLWERRPGRDAYTGAPLPRRGTPRSSSIIPEDIDDLDASDLLDPDDIPDEEEYDFFEDEEEEEVPVRPVRASGSLRPERTARTESPERAMERADRADRSDRLEHRKKKKRKDRLEPRTERGERPARAVVGDANVVSERVERPDRTDVSERGVRTPRPPREPRPPRDVARIERPSVAEAADAESTDGGDGMDDDGEAPRDGSARPEREGRKRRKRRRGNRAAGDGPAPMNASPDSSESGDTGPYASESDRSSHAGPSMPITPPFSGPRPFTASPPFPEPSAPAPQHPPMPRPDSGEDRSE